MELFPLMLHYSMTVISFFGTLFNLCLMPLILLRSGRLIGSYKILLFAYATVAMTNSLASFLTTPIFESTSTGWIFYATASRVPRHLGSYVICTFSATYIKLVLILMLSFTYRCSVCYQPGMKWFKEPKRIIVIILIFLVLSISLESPLFFYTLENPVVAINLELVGIYQLNISLVPYIGLPILEEEVLVWKSALLMGSWTLVMCLAFSVSAFCSYKILKELYFTKERVVFSERTKKVQKNLFLLLTYQTMVPLIFEFIPIMISYVLAFLQVSFPMFSAVSSISLPLAKMVDPILIVAIISDYRKAVLNFFDSKVQYNRRSVSSVLSNQRN